MGKTKIKTIDDSQPEVEEKKPVKTEKSSAAKTRSEALPTSEVNDSNKKQGAEQTPSEHTGDASDVLRTDEPSPKKKPQKPGKAKPRSKKYQEAINDLDRSKSYPIDEAVEMVKKLSYSKFTGTLETHINTVQTGIRGLVSLPYASGKKLKILAFGKDAQNCGADLVGDDSTIETISQGKVDFDLIITTPEWMPKLTKVTKILGPKGLMPNPKNGTITSGDAGLKKAVEGFQSGKTEYKTEPKAPVIHLGLGKLNQPTEQLSANITILLQTLGKSRIKKVSLSPTMGPSVKVDLSSL